MAAEPKCPSCESEGKQHIVTTPSEQKVSGGLSKFEIVYCIKCGHIYGAYPNFMIPG